ncbi:hypothetical protein AVEN_263905-1 [Araneus ventricosus]|uniref:Uncharacterized protein n=1 Tax=Araneus ventricosus TaxID=182803 RepID=A0A4Y2VQT4_ARAVE|nr:hypothetical protein AVEN_263905-1 [Araneus ventricosus]
MSHRPVCFEPTSDSRGLLAYQNMRLEHNNAFTQTVRGKILNNQGCFCRISSHERWKMRRLRKRSALKTDTSTFMVINDLEAGKFQSENDIKEKKFNSSWWIYAWEKKDIALKFEYSSNSLSTI